MTDRDKDDLTFALWMVVAVVVATIVAAGITWQKMDIMFGRWPR